MGEGSLDYPLLRPGTEVHVNTACPGHDDCFAVPATFHVARVVRDPARLAVPHRTLVRVLHSGAEFDVLRTAVRFPNGNVRGPRWPVLETGRIVYIKRDPITLCARCAIEDDFILSVVVEDPAAQDPVQEQNGDRIVVVDYKLSDEHPRARHYALRSELVVTRGDQKT